MKPVILTNFLNEELFTALSVHVREIRRAFEGTPFHDIDHPIENKFNRWYWHNLPMLARMHHSPWLRKIADQTFGEPVKPSYVFLSMYGEGGVCPLHTDRPQCKYTIDLCVSQAEKWPIFVDDVPYLLGPNEALAYSGTDQPHYRNPIELGNYCNLAFFHFVPCSFGGNLS